MPNLLQRDSRGRAYSPPLRRRGLASPESSSVILDSSASNIEGDNSPDAEAIRQDFTAHLAPDNGASPTGTSHRDTHRTAIQAARQAVLQMRSNDEIGDDAFHVMEEELDRLEMAIGGEPQ